MVRHGPAATGHTVRVRDHRGAEDGEKTTQQTREQGHGRVSETTEAGAGAFKPSLLLCYCYYTHFHHGHERITVFLIFVFPSHVENIAGQFGTYIHTYMSLKYSTLFLFLSQNMWIFNCMVISVVVFSTVQYLCTTVSPVSCSKLGQMSN